MMSTNELATSAHKITVETTGANLVSGLLIQTLWVVAAYCVARFAWRRGIKKYSAVGG